MAWTNVGFDGTINEAQWSALAGLLGNGYVAAGNGDCVVTAVPGARSVSVAAGSLYGDGVLSTNSAPETVAMTTPVNGQWYVIALRRTWATNTSALVAIAGATTTTTTPTAPPTSFPTLNTNVGVLTDQPIAWAWCNSANTTVVVYDIRLKAVKSLPPVVANANERDAKFMSPSQGLQVWRDDLGAVETYFGLYNASTNPGGRDTAGWYVADRQTGLLPIKPGTITAVSGSASLNSIGVITFTNVTRLSFDNTLSQYDNYRIIINITGATAGATQLWFRWRNAGSELSGTQYYQSGRTEFHNGSGTVWSIGGGDHHAVVPMNSGSPWPSAVLDIRSGGKTGAYNKVIGAGTGESASNNYTSWTSFSGIYTNGGGKDGFAILPDGGSMSGTIQILGVNG